MLEVPYKIIIQKIYVMFIWGLRILLVLQESPLCLVKHHTPYTLARGGKQEGSFPSANY